MNCNLLNNQVLLSAKLILYYGLFSHNLINFLWFHRSWPLLNFSSFSEKCAAILVSGDALFNALAGLCNIFGQCFPACVQFSFFRKTPCLLKI